MKPGVTVKPFTYGGWNEEGLNWRGGILMARVWVLVADSVMKQPMSTTKLFSDRRLETPSKPQGATLVTLTTQNYISVGFIPSTQVHKSYSWPSLLLILVIILRFFS